MAEDFNQNLYFYHVAIINFLNQNKPLYYYFCLFLIIFILSNINKINKSPFIVLFNPWVIVVWIFFFCAIQLDWSTPFINVFKGIKVKIGEILTYITFFVFYFIWFSVNLRLIYEYFKRTLFVFMNLRFYLYQTFIYKKKNYVKYFIILMSLLLPILIIYKFNMWSIIFSWYITIYFYNWDEKIEYQIAEKDRSRFLDYCIILFYILFVVFWLCIFIEYAYLINGLFTFPVLFCQQH